MNALRAFFPHIAGGLAGYFFPFTTLFVSALAEERQWQKRFLRALLRVTVTGLVLFWFVEAANLGWDNPETGILSKLTRWDWVVFLLLAIGIGILVYRREMVSNRFLAPLVLGFNVTSDVCAVLLVCAIIQAASGQEISPLAVLGMFVLLLLPVFYWWYSGHYAQSASAPITAAMTPYKPLAKVTAFNPALHLDTDRGICSFCSLWLDQAISNIFIPPEQREWLRWLRKFTNFETHLEYPPANQPEVELDPDSDPIAFWRRVYGFASGMEEVEEADRSNAAWFAKGGFIPVLNSSGPFAFFMGKNQFTTLYWIQMWQLVDDLAYRHRVEAAYGPVAADDAVAGPGETSSSDEGLLGYQGKRLPDGSVVVEAVRPNQPPRRLHPANSRKIWIHSDHFDWGYAGHAPAQLALAIALDFSQNRQMALAAYPAVLFGLVRGLALDQWFVPVENPPEPPETFPPGESWRKFVPGRKAGQKRRPSLNDLWKATQENRLTEVPATVASLPGDPQRDLFALRPPS